MADTSVKKQTISGAIWKFTERISAQLISFIVSIILARILAPDDYGLIALVFVFTTFCDKLLIAGFATSLIQKKTADDKDFSSVLYFSVAAAFVLYVLLFLGAPFIADFYTKFDRTELISVIRILGLSLFLMAFSSVQHAYASKHMLFKRYFWSTLGATVLSGIVGIAMAYQGFGVWALVAQNMLATFVGCIILWFTVDWSPKLLFSIERLKGLFSYGWKIFMASIIKTLYNDVRSLVIGKMFTPADLAYYNRGQSLPQLVDTNVTGTIDSVLFPAYSKLQDDKSAMLNAVRRAVKTSCYVLMPILALMAAVSSPLVSLLLTDKWLPCVPFMQILCFSFIFSPVEMENLQAIKAIGRSDIVLKLEIVKKTIGILLLIVSVPFGVISIAWSMMVSCLIAATLNASPNKKLIGYSIKQQLTDVMPSLIMSLLIFVGVQGLLVILPTSNHWIQLIVSGVAAIAFYIVASIVFKVESFKYMTTTISSINSKNKKNNE